MPRLGLNEYLLELAFTAAQRGTCGKRRVGAVIADTQNQIIATGYNGPPRGMPHCIDAPCPGLEQAAPQSHLACRAIHAEINALMLAGPKARGGTMAVTTSPCLECAKVIANSGIALLVIGEQNRLWLDHETAGISPRAMVERAGIEWCHAGVSN